MFSYPNATRDLSIYSKRHFGSKGPKAGFVVLASAVLIHVLFPMSAAATPSHCPLTSPPPGVVDTLNGPPSTDALEPHASFPASLFSGATPIQQPLDCSSWPEDSPDDGYLADIFGHRMFGGTLNNTDFHRGIDLRCNQHGKTCCNDGGSIDCTETTCSSGTEALAPVHAVVGGTVHRLNHGSTNSFVVRTTLTGSDVFEIGGTQCQDMYIWYSHLKNPYPNNPNTGNPWVQGESVPAGTLLGYQGKYGANTVHLHLSTRMCTNNLADNDPVGTLDPEVNPFQLLGEDDGLPPTILDLETSFDGNDLVVSVQVGTVDPDFDQLEVAVYDADNDTTTIRRMGYNSRHGVNVPCGDIDTPHLLPTGLAELTEIIEPDPPEPSSGLTYEARFEGLGLVHDLRSRVQVRVADVWGNTALQEVPIFGPTVLADAVLHLDAERGVELDGSGDVERWLDLSGNGHDAEQSDANQRPADTSDGVHFTRQHAMCVPHSGDVNPDAFTVFLVAQPEVEYNYAGLLTTLDLGARQGWNLLARSQNLTSDSFASSMQGNGTTTYQGNGGDLTMSQRHLISMRHGNPGTELTVNAVSPAAGYANQLISYTDTPLCLNLYYTDVQATSTRSDARYYEVLLFDRALDAAEEAEVNTYLMDKWGLTSP